MTNIAKEKLLHYFEILEVDHKLLPHFDRSAGDGYDDYHIFFENGKWHHTYRERGSRNYICSSEDLYDVLYCYMKFIITSIDSVERMELEKTDKEYQAFSTNERIHYSAKRKSELFSQLSSEWGKRYQTDED